MTHTNRTGAVVFSWILRLIAVGILAIAALTKLTSDPNAVKIFETLGAEPVGRFALGAVEALTALLILVPRTKLFGALTAVLLMVGAIGSHATKLGWAVELADGTKDSGMVVMAIILLGASLGLVFLHRGELPVIGARAAHAAD